MFVGNKCNEYVCICIHGWFNVTIWKDNLYARELRMLLRVNDMYHESIIARASGKDNSDRYMKKSLLSVWIF